MAEVALRHKLLNELIWCLPALACLALVIRIAILNPSATVLNIMGWAAAAVIALFTILMTRLGSTESNPSTTIKPVIFSLGATLLVAIQTIIWPLPYKRDRPAIYFSGDLKVGVSGDIPAWSGFDQELIEWIRNHYKKDGWQPVRLFQNQREEYLKNGEVHLVISSYTVTDLRAKHVDFAGPYFLDTTGVWGNLDKFKDGRWVNPRPGQAKNPTVCGVLGTTGNSSMASFLRAQDPGTGGAVQATKDYDNTADCLKDLFDINSEVAYAATDWSVLKAHKPNARVLDANRTHPNINKQTGEVLHGDPGLAGWETVDRPQYYGVAIRNNNPATCKDLTSVIQDFIDQTKNVNTGFNSAYNKHLKSHLGPVRNDWHKPNLNALDWGNGGSPICK